MGKFLEFSLEILTNQVVMEFMGLGSITDILDQFQNMPMTEPQIAGICLGVKA